MTINKEIRERAKTFSKRWSSRGSEKSDADNFWEDLLESVFGVERSYNYIVKQKPTTVEVSVKDKGEVLRKKYIDIYVPSSGCVIEHKSSNVSLDHEESQSDGRVLNARKDFY